MLNQEAKTILNNLRCPICKSKVDLLSYGYRMLLRADHNFGCSNNYDHYTISYIHWESPPNIEEERVVFYSKDKIFQITKMYPSNKAEVIISGLDVDYKIYTGIYGEKLEFGIDYFDFINFDQLRVIDLIDIYRVFE